MTRDEFRVLFEHALEVAAENAEKKLSCPVPREFEIEMHGLAPNRTLLTKDDALEKLYLGPDRFYQIIDVSVIRVSKDICTTVYICVSGHDPGSLSHTWNQPSGSGPFKQLLSEKIELS